jgi:hypothetical protein
VKKNRSNALSRFRSERNSTSALSTMPCRARLGTAARCHRAENILFIESAPLAESYSAYIDHLKSKYGD